MKIALLGYGKMGQLIERLAKAQDHTIIATQTVKCKALKENLNQADVFIDFSHPEAVLENVKLSISSQKPLVIGTTGWEKYHNDVSKLIQKSSIGCIYSPNFSLGIALYKSIIKHASKLIHDIKEYDVGGIETHHKTKVDSPSGTAKSLEKIVINNADRPLVFSSVRCGTLPGTHEIIMDSPFDTITLIHEAKSRDGFALGALKAAKWIIGKKGIYTMEDLCRFD